jgi:hypothetical protein
MPALLADGRKNPSYIGLLTPPVSSGFGWIATFSKPRFWGNSKLD